MTSIFVRVPHPASLDPSMVPDLADLAEAADPAFMLALAESGLGQKDVRQLHVRQLLDGGSDFYDLSLVEQEGRPGGMFCAYPLKQSFSRRSASLRHVLAMATEPRALRESLNRFAAGLPVLDGDAYYLSRIAVAPQWRGRRLGTFLMNRFESDAKEAGFERTCLHVLTQNQRAIDFYRARGYAPVAEGSSHTAMQRIEGAQA